MYNKLEEQEYASMVQKYRKAYGHLCLLFIKNY